MHICEKEYGGRNVSVKWLIRTLHHQLKEVPMKTRLIILAAFERGGNEGPKRLRIRTLI